MLSKTFAAFILLASLSRVACADVTVQGPPEETRAFLRKGESQVTLKGRASITVDASEIKGPITIVSEGATQSVALAAHEDQKKALIGRMQAIGIQRGAIHRAEVCTNYAAVCRLWGSSNRVSR